MSIKIHIYLVDVTNFETAELGVGDTVQQYIYLVDLTNFETAELGDKVQQ